MKLIVGLIGALALGASAVLAAPVVITVDASATGAPIRDDFIGLSFGMRALPHNKHFFSPTNTPLVTLFQNVGIRHLRLGGTTVESPPSTPIPGESEIDDLFNFAKVAGVKNIIYSFRLLESDPAIHYAPTNALLASYIWSHYRPQLECFALGNEPDLQRVFSQDLTIRDFDTYLTKWRIYAAAITNAVPEAKFTGPDGGSGQINWTTNFANSEKDSGLVSVVAEHFYAGGKGKGVSAHDGIETMLSPKWLKRYETLYQKVTVPVLADGLTFRFTEANDHYSGGIRDASDTFAGALWALDFLHWWAAHDTCGVDFHNTEWVSSDIIAPDPTGQLRINPKAYGLKAFDLGGHGRVERVTVSNSAGVNLTAYAIRGSTNLFITMINKEHGPGARAAEVTIVSDEIGKNSEAIYLTAPDGDVTAKTGVTLGGVSISNDRPWLGKWTPLKAGKSGRCTVKVAAATAAVVKITIH